MDFYPKAALERAMKIQEVILRAMAKKITWWQAAEILGFSDRHLRRMRERYEQFGYESLFDRRRSQLSQARALRPGGESAGPVSGEIFRSERPAFSREVTRAARHRSPAAPKCVLSHLWERQRNNYQGWPKDVANHNLLLSSSGIQLGVSFAFAPLHARLYASMRLRDQ